MRLSKAYTLTILKKFFRCKILSSLTQTTICIPTPYKGGLGQWASDQRDVLFAIDKQLFIPPLTLLAGFPGCNELWPASAAVLLLLSCVIHLEADV